MRKPTHIAVDSETNSRNFKLGNFLCLQFYANGKGAVLQTKEQWKNLKPDLEDPTIVKIIHNAAFDIPWIYEHTGILITNVWDTQLAEQIILGVGYVGEDGKYEYIPPELKPKYSTSLEAVLNRRGIAKLNKQVREGFVGKMTKKLTKEEEHYAMEDVRYLKELMIEQIEELERMDLMAVAELENRFVEVVAHMKIHGIGFDTKVWLDIEKENKIKHDELLEQLPSHVRWSSPVQVKRFFARKGIQINSFKELPKMKGKHPLLDIFIQYRFYQTLLSRYGSAWLTDKEGNPTVHSDGRIRCDFSQIISTGRSSCSNPNLQQIPDLTKTNLRYAFVPAKGCKFENGDFTGQELGIMAAGSKEKIWIDAMLNGDDVHSIMGAMLYGDRWEEAKEKNCRFPKRCDCPGHKPLRRQSKDLNFGLAYGKSAGALAYDMDISEEEATDLKRRYKSKIPRVSGWLNRNGKYAVTHKETFTLPPFNRRRSLELEPEEWRRRNQGMNTPVQGSGGDILKLVMCNLFDYIHKNKLQDKVKIVLMIHDEIITEVRNDFVKEWKPIMKRIMEESAAVVTDGLKLITVDPITSNKWDKQ